MNALAPAAVGAGGALALDVALAYVPMPAMVAEHMQKPLVRAAVKVAGAFGIGWLASFVVGQQRARAATAGALVVVTYGVLRDFIAQNFPQVPLAGIVENDLSNLSLSGGVGYLNPAPMVTGSGVGAYMRETGTAPVGVGAYMRDSIDPVNLNGSFSDGM